MKRREPLPEDVKPDQLWLAPDGQHYRVLGVDGKRAALNRATPAGRVLNSRYELHHEVDRVGEPTRATGNRPRWIVWSRLFLCVVGLASPQAGGRRFRERVACRRVRDADRSG